MQGLPLNTHIIYATCGSLCVWDSVWLDFCVCSAQGGWSKRLGWEWILCLRDYCKRYVLNSGRNLTMCIINVQRGGNSVWSCLLVGRICSLTEKVRGWLLLLLVTFTICINISISMYVYAFGWSPTERKRESSREKDWGMLAFPYIAFTPSYTFNMDYICSHHSILFGFQNYPNLRHPLPHWNTAYPLCTEGYYCLRVKVIATRILWRSSLL